jgi:hypothetical protein
MVEGAIRIWWRLDDNLDLDLDKSAFEIQDLGITAYKFQATSPGVFAVIYDMFHTAEFISNFAGGSVAQVSVGDVIEAGSEFGLPCLGMLIDFDALHKWGKTGPVDFVKVGSNLLIADVCCAHFKPLIFTL